MPRPPRSRRRRPGRSAAAWRAAALLTVAGATAAPAAAYDAPNAHALIADAPAPRGAPVKGAPVKGARVQTAAPAPTDAAPVAPTANAAPAGPFLRRLSDATVAPPPSTTTVPEDWVEPFAPAATPAKIPAATPEPAVAPEPIAPEPAATVAAELVPRPTDGPLFGPLPAALREAAPHPPLPPISAKTVAATPVVATPVEPTAVVHTPAPVVVDAAPASDLNAVNADGTPVVMVLFDFETDGKPAAADAPVPVVAALIEPAAVPTPGVAPTPTAVAPPAPVVAAAPPVVASPAAPAPVIAAAPAAPAPVNVAAPGAPVATAASDSPFLEFDLEPPARPAPVPPAPAGRATLALIPTPVAPAGRAFLEFAPLRPGARPEAGAVPTLSAAVPTLSATEPVAAPVAPIRTVQPSAVRPANLRTVTPRPAGAVRPASARPARVAPVTTTPATAPVPAAVGPTAFGRYCPVAVRDDRRLTDADPRVVTQFGGKTYRFASPVARAAFLLDPTRYLPVADGEDVVLAAAEGFAVPGRVEHAVLYGGRLFLFRNARTRTAFTQDPAKWVNADATVDRGAAPIAVAADPR